ncbi:hypothetical protein OSH11_24275 [Kaistia dalseonensis]|uniref:Localization factor PodJL n=1 Tax=Kaistia dalseonensis TaxID=410840 RepID=A0ABU0HDS5_9HYPH|nr:hypothetical protein [Kaistia dalseonensis]MCX5497838.1 hypothetical protein [Kaistia dalseonensis]MDQ0440482.1 localization factor PodJL [Kaistia dalseonensis]
MRSGNRFGYDAPRSAPAQAPSEPTRARQPNSATRLAALASLVDELGAQIDAIEGASRRGAIKRGIEQAATAPREPVSASREAASTRPARQPNDAERLANIEARLASISQHLTGPQKEASARPTVPPARSRSADSTPASQALDELQAAIAEISARQHTIDRDEGRGLPTVDTIALEDAIANLRDDIVAIGRRVGLDQRRGAESFDVVRDNLAEIRQAIELTAREATLASMESGYGHIVERLDEIVRRVPERDRIDDIAREIARLAAIAERPAVSLAVEAELDDIRDAIASFSTARPAADAHEIAELRKAIDALASRSPQPIDLTPVEQEIAAIRREIGSLGKSIDPALLARLEDQVTAIRGAIDRSPSPETGLPAAALTRLEDRLDALAGRFDALVDLPGLKARHSTDAIDLLRNEIGALRRDIVAREPIRLDSIEEQMRGLMRRLDDTTSRDDNHGFAQLEAQVGALAAQFSEARPSPGALSKVEQNLDRLEALLGDTRRETVEAARNAARLTVQEFAGAMPAADESLIGALRDDLRALQAAAQRSDRKTHDTLEAVHDTLAKVVDRIAEIEGNSDALATTRPPTAGRTDRQASIGIDPIEDYRPLAPGSGKPKPSTERPPVRDSSANAGGDRKADFIAAARRAAQAAQAETALARMEEEAAQEDDRPGALARIGQAFRARRRPLVLAIAAIVLALGAVQLGPTISEQIAKATNTPAALDPVPTGSVAPKPMRDVTPAPAPALVPQPAASTSTPLVAPAGNGDTPLAFQPADPITDYIAALPTAPSPSTFATPGQAAKTLDIGIVQAAAAKGDGVAAFELAKRFADGDGVPRDAARAANWYERAAKAGLAIAQYRLGSLHEHGEGVKLDRAIAQDWYEQASAAGNARATHNLAVLISEGANGAPDFAKAAALFAIAADLGVADSQYNLGVLYARGLGVSVDLIQSYTWFALAAQQGDQDAGKRRDEVAKALTPDNLAKARAAVQAFRPKPLDAVANSEPTPKPEWLTAAGQTTMLAPAASGSKG